MRNIFLLVVIILAVSFTVAMPSAYAFDYVFEGTIDGVWGTVGNWDGGSNPSDDGTGSVGVNASITDTSASSPWVDTIEFSVSGVEFGSGCSITVASGATFNGTDDYSGSYNYGSVTGNATFNDSSTNYNLVSGDANFLEYSSNTSGATVGSATFSGSSYNGGYVWDFADFYDQSHNAGQVTNNATFFGSSYNWGTVGGTADFTENAYSTALTGRYNPQQGTAGTTQFSGADLQFYLTGEDWDVDTSGWSFTVSTPTWNFGEGSSNSVTGNLNGGAVFDVDAYNHGQIGGDVTFNDSSYNGGTVSGNATFNDSSYNDSNGSVTFIAEFTESAYSTALTGTYNPQQGSAGTTLFSAANVTFTLVSGESWTVDTSTWTFTDLTPTWNFGDGSYLTSSGSIVGDAVFSGSACTDSGSNIEGNVTFQNNTDVIMSGTISGAAGTVTVNAPGAVVTLNNANTYMGATTITSGTLRLGADGALGTTDEGTSVASGAALDLNGIIYSTNEELSIIGTGVAGTGALTNSNSGAWAGYLGVVTIGAGGATIGGTGDIELYSGLGANANALTKVGDNILTLQSASSRTGAVTISNGTIKVGADGALGTNAATILVSSGGSLDLNGVSYSTASALTLNGAGESDGGALQNSGADSSYAGGIILGSSSTISSGAGNGLLTITGGITGSGNLTLDSTSLGVITISTADVNHSGSITNQGGGAAANVISSVIGANVTGVVQNSGTSSLTLSGVNLYTGATTISSGTLILDATGTIATSSGVANSGTLEIQGNKTIDSMTGTGATTLGANTLTIGDATGTSCTYGGIASGTGGLTKAGAGTLTLSGINAYTGATTISAGTLTLAANGTIEDSSGVANSGTLVIQDNKTIDSMTGTGATTLGANTLTIGDATGTSCTYGGIASGTGGLTKAGTGTLTLSGANAYTGATTISAGTLTLDATGTIAASSGIANSGTLVIQGNKTIDSMTGTGATTLGANTLTIGDATGTSCTYGGIASGTGGLTKAGAGMLTLSGVNAYTGDTTISAGTLKLGASGVISNSSDVIIDGTLDTNGYDETVNVLTVQTGGTIELGSTTLTSSGAYNQDAGSTLNLTVSSLTASGSIATGAAAVIAAGSTIGVTVTDSIYIPTGTAYTIVDTSGAGFGSVPGTITSSNSHLSFLGSSSGGNLVLTVDRSSTGFAHLAGNANQAAIGAVLDNITNPSGDMTTVLNTLEGLSQGALDSALNSMEPNADGSSLQVIQLALNQFTDTILGHQSSLRGMVPAGSGVSTGTEMLEGVDIWAQGYGSYLHQDKRQLSQGYNATIWGTALGFDLPVYNDNLRLGAAFGFAQDYVRGKDNSNRNDVNSYQWTIYSEYARDAYYIDLLGSFAYNTYDASRQVAVGTISRTASADYSGQQYAVYVEAGYTFNFKDLGFDEVTVSKPLSEKPAFSITELNFTPLVSFQYQHLNLEKYTETGADSLNLTVKAQGYDLAQTGLGIKLDYPLDTKYGQLVPELRFKWLYDWVGDAQATTANFNGGGGSFATNGFEPAQSSWDFGSKLTMYTKNNWTMAVNYDFELKEDFYGHYGYVNAKYSF